MSLSVAWHPFIRCKKARFGQSSLETRYAKKLPILGSFFGQNTVSFSWRLMLSARFWLKMAMDVNSGV